jgi:superfamily II DNA or RNA helicase
MASSQDLAKYFEHNSVKYHSQTTGHRTWLWASVPEDVLEQSGYITNYLRHRMNRLERYRNREQHLLPDYGIDAVAFDGSVHHILQMKHYPSGNRITGGDLGTTLAVSGKFRSKNQASKIYLYFHGQFESNFADCLPYLPIVPIHLPAVVDGVKGEVTTVTGVTTAILDLKIVDEVVSVVDDVINESTYPLFAHQTECLRCLSEDWDGNGSIVLPCGTGKTIILNTFAKRYTKVIYLSRYRSHADQNLHRFTPFTNSGQLCHLVDSDGTRDVDQLRQITKTDSWMLSATYKSVDVLLKVFRDGTDGGEDGDGIEDVLVIIDEVHNAETNDNIKRFCELFQRSLGATATPSEDSHWTPLFTYSLSDAISTGVICDYNVYLPEVTDVTGSELGIVIDDSEMLYQAKFLLDGLLKTGSRRCIAKLSSKAECSKFLLACQNVGIQYHGITVIGTLVTDETSHNQRRSILENFKADVGVDTVKILANVFILTESIDIVKCDSVYLNRGNFRNNAKPVQAAFRAIRKDRTNPNKVANIFVWSDCDTDLMNTFSLLKESDISFCSKVNYVSYDYDYQNESASRQRVAAKKVDFDRQLNVISVSLRQRRMTRILELCDYYKLHGKWPIQKEPLGQFLSGLRLTFKGKNHKKPLRDDELKVLTAADQKWYEGIPESRRIGKIRLIYDFFQHYQRWPTQDEPLGVYFNYIRQVFKGNMSGKLLNKEELDMLVSCDKNWCSIEGRRIEKIKELVQIYKATGKWPTQKEPLGWFLGRLRGTNKGTGGGENRRPLQQDELDILTLADPNWHRAVDEDKRLRQINSIISFFQTHSRWPKRTEKLGRTIDNLRQTYKGNRGSPLNQEELELLSSVDLNWHTGR